jgi:hypothetical protein
MSKPKQPDDPEPATYFQLERRRRRLEQDDGPGDAIPPLPASSPWAADVIGKEPSIDRSEDGDVFIPTEGGN